MEKISPILQILEDAKPNFHVKSGNAKVLSSEKYFAMGAKETEGLPRTSHAIREKTLYWLDQNIQSHHTTLETGGGYSTVIFGAKAREHYCINPDATGNKLVSEFLSNNNINAGTINFINDTSDIALPKLDLRGRLDYILIDGNHSFPYPITDWHYTFEFLKVNGSLLIDDIHIPSVTILVDFLFKEPAYQFVENISGCAHFKKIKNERIMGWADQPFNAASKFSMRQVKSFLKKAKQKILPA